MTTAINPTAVRGSFRPAVHIARARDATAIFGLDLIAFHIQGLPKLPKASRLNSAFPRHVRDDYEFPPIGIGVNSCIQAGTSGTHLAMESTG